MFAFPRYLYSSPKRTCWFARRVHCETGWGLCVTLSIGCGYLQGAVEAVGHEAHQIVGPARKIESIGAEPVVHDLAFQLREHLHDEAQVVVHLDMAVVLQGVEKHGFAVFWHDGLPEGRVDRILDGLTEEIALLGDEPQMVVVARFPIDGAADLVQIELAAEDGVPPRGMSYLLSKCR